MLIAIISGVVIAFLPLFPYSPRCYERDEPTNVGDVLLAEDYRRGLTAHLTLYEVPYLRVGNVVLLRFWTWFADPESWVANASNKTVEPLAEGKYHAVGKPVPPHVQRMVEEARRPDRFRINLECPLVRAVAIDGW